MPSSHLYAAQGVAAGHDADLVRRASEYARRISARGHTPIFTLRHLATLVDADYTYLRRIVERRRDEYDDILRPKRDGTLRPISSPRPVLLETQRWILHNALQNVSLHDAAFAYRAGMSIVDCANQHVGARWFVKMDLHNFFGSIQEQRVFAVFQELAYPRLLCFELARLCTRVVPSWDQATNFANRGLASYRSTERAVLPQGAPTSGALANAVARRLDARLAAVAQEHSLVYSRYSDDLTFSSNRDFDRSAAKAVIRDVEAAVHRSDFEVHRGKTKLVPPGARATVLGLIVHANGVRLRPGFRRQTENHVRCVEKFGPAAHAAQRRFDSVLSMINYVDGCLAFASDVERPWAVSTRNRWDRALRTHGHPR